MIVGGRRFSGAEKGASAVSELNGLALFSAFPRGFGEFDCSETADARGEDLFAAKDGVYEIVVGGL